MNQRAPSGPTLLAIITTVACVLAAAAIAIMLGLLEPDELARLGRLAQ